MGACSEDSGVAGVNGQQADQRVLDSGAAYVFVRTGATWTQQKYIKASNPGYEDNFGESLALSGDTLVVGASSVALAGDTLAVGAIGEGSAATGVDGDRAVYVFVRRDATWKQEAYVKASTPKAGGGRRGLREQRGRRDQRQSGGCAHAFAGAIDVFR